MWVRDFVSSIGELTPHLAHHCLESPVVIFRSTCRHARAMWNHLEFFFIPSRFFRFDFPCSLTSVCLRCCDWPVSSALLHDAHLVSAPQPWLIPADALDPVLHSSEMQQALAEAAMDFEFFQ